MSKEIIPAFTVTDMQTMAQSVAKSRLFGLDEPQAFTLMMLAQAEGIHPVKAVQRYHVIQGRPAMQADAMLADFQKIGGRVEWTTESDDHEKCEGIFHHPVHAPGGRPVRFTMADAKTAGLDKKDVWKQYPSSMLRARVISIGIRMYAPGIVAGLYTPEEVGSFTDPIDVEARQVPEHHAINHDNGTGHGSGAYAPPDVVEAYQNFVDSVVTEVNQKWCDRLTSPPDGEILSKADGQITDTWELSGHLLKWARSMDWVKAPLDIQSGQRDKFAAVAWEKHKDEFHEEAQRYFKRKWNEKLRAARAKTAKAAGAKGKRETPEVLELQAEGEVLDDLMTTEAGAPGMKPLIPNAETRKAMKEVKKLITRKQFSKHLNRQPFQPFKLVVAGGHDVTIDAPEFACIDREGRVIRFSAKDHSDHIIDARHVTRIAAVET